MKGLAAYFAGQTLKPESAKNKASIELGQKLWRAGDLKRGIRPVQPVTALPVPAPPSTRACPASLPTTRSPAAGLPCRRARQRSGQDDATIAVKMTDPEIKAVADYAAGLR
jgi:hypothetical protein